MTKNYSRFKQYPQNMRELYQCLKTWHTCRKNMRFGQFMVNMYVDADESWSELFYEEDTTEAFQMCIVELHKKKNNVTNCYSRSRRTN